MESRESWGRDNLIYLRTKISYKWQSKNHNEDSFFWLTMEEEMKVRKTRLCCRKSLWRREEKSEEVQLRRRAFHCGACLWCVCTEAYTEREAITLYYLSSVGMTTVMRGRNSKHNKNTDELGFISYTGNSHPLVCLDTLHKQNTIPTSNLSLHTEIVILKSLT